MSVPLLQEDYKQDLWKFLVCCVCLNKTSGDAARKVMPAFFGIFHSPKMVIGHSRAVEDLLQPLGLQKQRAKRIHAMSMSFLEKEPKTLEEIGRLPGVGKYALDSYRILILRETTFVEPLDKKLKEWLSQ